MTVCDMRKRIIILLATGLVLPAPSPSHSQSAELADQYWEQAEALKEQGAYLEATRMYEKSAQVEKASPQPRVAYLVLELGWAGLCLEQVSRYEEALEYFQEALTFGRRLSRDDTVTNLLTHIGRIYSA